MEHNGTPNNSLKESVLQDSVATRFGQICIDSPLTKESKASALRKPVARPVAGSVTGAVDRVSLVDPRDTEPAADPVNSGRTEYLDWDEYFMAVSFLSAQRSKDPATQVGACIVSPDKRIVGIGYNGFPRGCSDRHLPWGKTSENELENKYMYVCHAEMNAIMNKNSASVEGCTIYVALFPCNECSKMIIQSGIKKIVFFSDKHSAKTSTIASKRLLDLAGVKYTQYTPRMKSLTIDFCAADPTLYLPERETCTPANDVTTQ